MSGYYFIIAAYWILFLVLSVYIILKKNYKLFEKISPYLLFTSLFFYFLIWIPQGLDITDDGYTLTKSWFTLHGGWKENLDMRWMSSVINGLWLSIYGRPSLFWARIGYAIIVSAISVLTFLILEKYFSKTKTFITVFLITVFYNINTNLSVNYNILPVFFILLSVYFLFSFIHSGHHRHLMIAGFFSALLGFIKFPFCLSPLLYIFYLKYFLPSGKADLKRIFRNSLIGLFAGYLFGTIPLILSDSFSIYFNNLAMETGLITNPFPSLDPSHTFSSLFSFYADNFYRLSYSFFTGIFILIIFLISISYIRKRFGKFFISVLFIYFVYLIAKKGDSEQWEYISITFGLVYLFFNLFKRNSDKQLNLLMLYSVLIFILSFLGSDVGIITGLKSGGFLLLSSVSVLMADDLDFDKVPYVNNFAFRYLKLLFFGFLILVLIWKKPDDVYRDRPRNELTATFKTRELHNIKSNKERVLATDSLLTFINQSVKSNESFFTVGPLPMFYYLLNKRPVIKDLWTCSPREFEKSGMNDTLIDYFLIPGKDPRDNSWPNSDVFPLLECDKECVSYYKKYVDLNLYGKVFENKMFSLYAAPQIIFNMNNSILLENNNCTEFEKGILTGWSRHRLNSLFSVSSDFFHSAPSAQTIHLVRS